MTTSLTTPREVERLVKGMPTSDGAGVKLLRVLTQDLQVRLDPFLMLDYFHTDNPQDYLAGFPEHPHRGFETVTYMLDGRMRHRDNTGNEGVLSAGGVQWMTAGRGIVHAEMPEQVDGLMQGFQLWLNLPADRKMVAPAYRDIAAAEIPVLRTGQGVTVKVIAGEALGQAGAMQVADTEPLYLDLQLPAGTTFEHPLDEGFNSFAYVYEGSALLGERGQRVAAGQMAILETRPGRDGVRIAAGDVAARVLLIGGRPLREPIAQWGPFVMNSREEVMQAVQDFQTGNF
ncbi:pirin family protein [Chitinimonas arctica]|uniref:Pirin family protein n=1 Tax=Chitinimonas arctica TaxID=2594795 RepID=A0A516SIS0_9NEIS|nr:pirin family protein [Chitinimonas arctica]QDQ28055.1 pirin family protein [Chitinimonas arctica]